MHANDLCHVPHVHVYLGSQVFLEKYRVELQGVVSDGRKMEQTYFDILVGNYEGLARLVLVRFSYQDFMAGYMYSSTANQAKLENLIVLCNLS